MLGTFILFPRFFSVLSLSFFLSISLRYSISERCRIRSSSFRSNGFDGGTALPFLSLFFGRFMEISVQVHQSRPKSGEC